MRQCQKKLHEYTIKRFQVHATRNVPEIFFDILIKMVSRLYFVHLTFISLCQIIDLQIFLTDESFGK